MGQNRKGLIGHESIGSVIVSLGPEYCFADTKETAITQSPLRNYDISFGIRIKYPTNFGYRVSIGYSAFTGSDGASPARSYSFASQACHIAAMGEYTLSFGNVYGDRIAPNSVYIFAGMGLLNSRANLNYSFKTDYEYNTNATVSPFIPVGIGYQYNLSNNFQLGVEYNVRWSFSDYLDGFKPPYPASKSSDVLQGFSITLGYRAI